MQKHELNREELLEKIRDIKSKNISDLTEYDLSSIIHEIWANHTNDWKEAQFLNKIFAFHSDWFDQDRLELVSDKNKFSGEVNQEYNPHDEKYDNELKELSDFYSELWVEEIKKNVIWFYKNLRKQYIREYELYKKGYDKDKINNIIYEEEFDNFKWERSDKYFDYLKEFYYAHIVYLEKRFDVLLKDEDQEEIEQPNYPFVLPEYKKDIYDPELERFRKISEGKWYKDLETNRELNVAWKRYLETRIWGQKYVKPEIRNTIFYKIWYLISKYFK